MRKTNWNDNWLFWNSKDAFALVWDIPQNARKIDLPHDAMIETTPHADSINGGNTGFYDGGSYTYVKFYESKPGDRERNISLLFEGIYMNSFVYVNGQLAGNRPYGYSEFIVPISHLLKEEGENEIRIQVKNSSGKNSRWYTGSGIYRDVYMLTGGKTYVKENSFLVSTEDCSEEEATVLLSANVMNGEPVSMDIAVCFELMDRVGKVIAKERKIVSTKADSESKVLSRLFVENPLLWSEDNPELYKAVVTVSVAKTEDNGSFSQGEILDTEETTIGIRKLSLDSRHGLRVNGKTVKLRGACVHHDSGILGAKTYKEAEYRRISILKKAGFNAIRMSHHPAAPVLLEACDELGMYVMEEAFDMWTRAKSDYDYNLYFMDWWERDIEAMVLKDYNHPSVIMYSIGNEIPEIGTDEGSRLAGKISALCHKLDPYRFTLASINGVFAAGDAVPQITADVASSVGESDDSINVNDFMTIMDKYMDKIVVHPEITKRLDKACAMTDIAGYNYMTARYVLDNEINPNRIIVGSETYPPEIAVNWREVMKFPQVIGDFTWTGWDYLGEAGVGIPAYNFGEGGFGAQFPAKLAYTGDVDITGFRRPLSYYREIVFGLRKAPYIAVQNPAHYGEKLIKTPWVMSDAISSWNFDGYENKPVIIEVYSAGDEVELFVNDKRIEKKKINKEDNCRVLFETVYKPGNLKVVSYSKGEKTGEYELVTAKGDIRLVAEIDENTSKGDKHVFVNLMLEDADGNTFTDRDETITAEIEGDGVLLGFGSGDPKSQEAYTGNVTKTYYGRALAVIQRKSVGNVALKVSLDDGKQIKINI
ncbi:glycoside hydrolase family 2 TIM barrel-domain containing protein [Butyrivibrio sp. WCE2006]|uniref:glycoside hydrolase family 2 TIM barrel-domain containing protein n=1 Tax=Butyrivibrio sp. WCE2006 TaxID=1410611 RepID=UPI0005D25040|nr:glycoside hydrolase family 2 TIM barrel-domain containing protein [Butyrivibrio sp. WCE2006]